MPERHAKDLADRAPRVEGVVRALEDVLQAPARVALPLPRCRLELTAVQEHVACARRVEPGDHPGERRLAGARLAYERKALGAAHREGDVVQHLLRAVKSVDRPHLEQGRGDLGLAPRRQNAIETLSRSDIILPGDVIAFPLELRPPVSRGDTVELEIEKIGVLRTPVR